MKLSKFILTILSVFSSSILFAQGIQKIKLSESTRGFQKEITLSKEKIVIEQNSVLKQKKISAIQWKQVMKIMQNISLEKLSSYVPPSSKRASDGALHTVLEIQTKDKTYQSQTFDNDNPPKELKALVTALAKF